MARDGELADDRDGQDAVTARAMWPWALFSAALLAGLVSFFAFTPR
ncbi:MAG TPA: hypothetical protein VEW03_02320 [Longimicrobiaceae bacterium]|nr:hypothetical protein [Longimicrobiaceae bacterium]